jgi:hypothetical protein
VDEACGRRRRAKRVDREQRLQKFREPEQHQRHCCDAAGSARTAQQSIPRAIASILTRPVASRANSPNLPYTYSLAGADQRVHARLHHMENDEHEQIDDTHPPDGQPHLVALVCRPDNDHGGIPGCPGAVG